VYETDLQTMVSIFFQQNIELHAKITQTSGTRQSGRVRVTLVKGTIVGCLIKWNDGTALSGSEALHVVERLGSLAWDYTPLMTKGSTSITPQQGKSPESTPMAAGSFAPQEKQASTMPPGTSSPGSSQLVLRPNSVPVRTRAVSQQQFVEWSRSYRSVFNLVDGHNSIEKIAHLLTKPYEIVEKIVSDLHMQGIVACRAHGTDNFDDPVS
jgi:hypothetical protein